MSVAISKLTFSLDDVEKQLKNVVSALSRNDVESAHPCSSFEQHTNMRLESLHGGGHVSICSDRIVLLLTGDPLS